MLPCLWFSLTTAALGGIDDRDVPSMLVVAGLSLKNLHPRVWDVASPYFVPELRAVMVSYGEFHQMPSQRKKAQQLGVHRYLGVPSYMKVYLDNGAFYFLRSGFSGVRNDYQQFVETAKPDWYPVAFDVIPTPQMSNSSQVECYGRTMQANRAFDHDGYVPVIHVSRMLEKYVKAVQRNPKLSAKNRIALGAIVPNLLRAPRAMSYDAVLSNLLSVREKFPDKDIHVFGVGGTATVHLAAILGIDSIDSSGWRNRAARGIVQLPGSGDRMVANLGKWRGRAPSADEWRKLRSCRCPACGANGVRGLKASGIKGFCNRATHNLWVLLEEARWLERHISNESYARNYKRRLDNSTYAPLITRLLEMTAQRDPNSV